MPNVSFILKTRTKHSDFVIFGLSQYGMSDTYLFRWQKDKVLDLRLLCT